MGHMMELNISDKKFWHPCLRILLDVFKCLNKDDGHNFYVVEQWVQGKKNTMELIHWVLGSFYYEKQKKLEKGFEKEEWISLGMHWALGVRGMVWEQGRQSEWGI